MARLRKDWTELLKRWPSRIESSLSLRACYISQRICKNARVALSQRTDVPWLNTGHRRHWYAKRGGDWMKASCRRLSMHHPSSIITFIVHFADRWRADWSPSSDECGHCCFLKEMLKWIRQNRKCRKRQKKRDAFVHSDVRIRLIPCLLVQSNGNTLFNLKCSDVEGGLLGRHLLTFMKNVAISKREAVPDLPAHKFTPHDIVEIRPSKGGLGPSYASGLVYRYHLKSVSRSFTGD